MDDDFFKRVDGFAEILTITKANGEIDLVADIVAIEFDNDPDTYSFGDLCA